MRYRKKAGLDPSSHPRDTRDPIEPERRGLVKADKTDSPCTGDAALIPEGPRLEMRNDAECESVSRIMTEASNGATIACMGYLLFFVLPI